MPSTNGNGSVLVMEGFMNNVSDDAATFNRCLSCERRLSFSIQLDCAHWALIHYFSDLDETLFHVEFSQPLLKSLCLTCWSPFTVDVVIEVLLLQHLSIRMQQLKILGVLFPGLKPVCSSASMSSAMVVIQFCITFSRTLHGWLIRLIIL